MVSAVLLASGAAASTRVDFNLGWAFRTDPDLAGVASGWTQAIPAGAQPVNVPHTWNIGEFHDYMGVGWYFRRFEMPPIAPGTHVELHFGATFYKARIWLNGVEVGAHEGGFTAYAIDITAHLRNSNLLAVQIDNRPGAATIPGFGARGEPTAWYDWWAYGGIVRDVWLTESGPAWIDRQNIRSEMDNGHALIRDRIFLQSTHQTAGVVRVTAYEPDDRQAARASLPVSLTAGKADITLSLDMANPKLWSIDYPRVYRMDVELLDAAGTVLDRHSDTFGVRTVEIKDRHLYLNGERVRLTGLARHEDSPWEGLAETRGTMRHDFDDMKALHATLTRPVHYPQNPFILDYADRHGILLIPEIPVWQFSEAQLSDPKVLALAEQQMQEMIEQAGNHPSIFAWSVANESATGTPGGVAYFRSMRDFIRRLDPGKIRELCGRQFGKARSRRSVRGERRRFSHDESILRDVAWSCLCAQSCARQGQSILSRQNGDHLGIRLSRILREQPVRSRSLAHQDHSGSNAGACGPRLDRRRHLVVLSGLQIAPQSLAGPDRRLR